MVQCRQLKKITQRKGFNKMKKFILHTIDSNGTKDKCYTNDYELTVVINWILQHNYIIKRIEKVN